MTGYQIDKNKKRKGEGYRRQRATQTILNLKAEAVPLIIDLLLVDGRDALVDVPLDVVLLVQPSVLIRDRNNLTRVRNLLQAHTKSIARNPEQRSFGVN